MAPEIIKSLSNNPSFYGPAIVMKASLVISFILHIIILLGFQKAFPLHWRNEELRTYRVELIRTPVKDIEIGDNQNTHLDHTRQKEALSPENSQDTISLDTKDKRYISYAKLIKREIMRYWRYPPEARAYLIEGRLMALFSLVSDGRMTQISVARASGHKVLDQEVLRAIKRAAPFPPFPESITVKRLNIKASFDYRLTSGKRN
jgi:TonB family protein